MATETSSERKPDYAGGGIANLTGSIIAACGGTPPCPPLAALPPETLARQRNLVLMVIDGLGYDFLARRPDSFLHRQVHARLTSVFPTTTASAVTTLLTGLAPLQHGLTGWFTWLQELGSVAAVLPFRPRHGGKPFNFAGIDPAAVLDFTPLTGRVNRASHMVSAQSIVDSVFSRASAGAARRHGYATLDDFIDTTLAIVRNGQEHQYVHAYWPELDSLAHAHGVGSSEVEHHFLELDRACARFAAGLAGSGTTALLCADHGLIDTAPEKVVQLERHPRLAQTLALPLCGEPRVAYCYLRPGRVAAFLDYVRGELSHCCDVVSAEELIDSGYFGNGTPHPRLRQRVGDYVLLMRDNFVLKDRLLGEQAFQQIGVHGGLSSAELYVPLIVLEG